MNIGKAILAGLIAGVVSFLVGSALYMNPLVSKIYEKYANLPVLKPMEVFGSLWNWLGLMALGGIVSTIIVAIIYAVIHKSLPGGILKKGLLLGLVVWLIGVVPNAYNTWLLINYPVTLIYIEVFNGLVGSLVTGVLIAWIYGANCNPSHSKRQTK